MSRVELASGLCMLCRRVVAIATRKSCRRCHDLRPRSAVRQEEQAGDYIVPMKGRPCEQTTGAQAGMHGCANHSAWPSGPFDCPFTSFAGSGNADVCPSVSKSERPRRSAAASHSSS